MSDTAAEILGYMTKVMVDEGAVVIQPHPEPFRAKQRNFLDGIRSVPAAISAPAGTNPFTSVLDRPGRWLFVWIPDK
jgi:hypothetical protein